VPVPRAGGRARHGRPARRPPISGAAPVGPLRPLSFRLGGEYDPGVVDDPRAVATVRIDNERVRVTEWRFTPGAHTGHHRHEFAYVVVPLTTGRLAARAAGVDTVNELVTGQPYFRPAGVEHDVSNPNGFEFAFIEIELKDAG
jgi:beta-alanine degradation protein BauB